MISERETVHVSDDTGRIAMLELRTYGTAANDGNSAAVLERYIYSNHLQSASLELDDNGTIISYEEYHPYGTTSYQAKSGSINAIAKRYRYTGKERDEESGLYYHGARYYVPWLCRWCAPDPSGAAPTTCSESSNDFSLSAFGYSSSLCGDFCSTAPDLSYSASDLENTNFSAPFNDAFFTEVDYKGAIQADDWTASWTQWCPQSASYCSFSMLKAKAEETKAGDILFSPNPSHSVVTLSFIANETGTAQLSVLDKVTGSVLISKDVKIQMAGPQSLSISVSNIREGVYPVLIKMRSGILQGKLVVK